LTAELRETALFLAGYFDVVVVFLAFVFDELHARNFFDFPHGFDDEVLLIIS
jgi:hypothetical protein